MANREFWIGRCSWLVALVTGAVTVAVEIAQPQVGSLVSLSLLAALIGLWLSVFHFRALCLLIAIAMVLPVLFAASAGHPMGVAEVAERLAGLVCLGLLAAFSQRSETKPSNWQAPRDFGLLNPNHWIRSLLKPQPVSEFVDLDHLGNQFQLEHLLADESGDGGPVTEDAIEISAHADGLLPHSDRDADLSFDERQPCESDATALIRRLRDRDVFTQEQVALIETELRTVVGSHFGVKVGSPLSAGVRVGRFIVDGPLGRGGEASVYRGHDDVGEPAAIKILQNIQVSDRFRREMHVVRQLAHPNIVTAYEVGDFRGLPFIAMELLRGPDLHVLVRDSGPLNWQTSARYMLQAARALEHAHQRDLIHRDIKPANLILNGNDLIKLADMGLASMVGHDASIDSVGGFKTKHGHLAGTLPYMAPEQARSLADATVQSDIYGLGATWFYLLTGRERLPGETFSEQFQNLLLERRFEELPRDLLPDSLRQVFEKMLAYDAKDRYASCDQLSNDLERALVGCGEAAGGVAGIDVLVVEDSQTDMLLTIKMLKRSNSTLSIHQARTLADGLEICSRLPINLALLDLSLPDSSGVATVSRFREKVPQLPLVVLTGMSQDEVGSACLQAGADTFISKSSLTPHRMERTIFVTLSRCGPRSYPAKTQSHPCGVPSEPGGLRWGRS
mgnify:FL=1